MRVLRERLEELERAFDVPGETVCEIAKTFSEEMLAGRWGQGSLKMLPTFITPPTGKELGDFLTIDFGGTNVRIGLIGLGGDGCYKIKRTCSVTLRDSAGNYDYTSENTTAEELFDFIVLQIGHLTKDCRTGTNLLGHTFSFPTQQINSARAILLNWTKEFKTGGVEGKEVTALLEAALDRISLQHIKPVVILNDTTATLLTAAYLDSDAHIGSICGTGHNTCYLEGPMLINIESGNFNKFPITVFDRLLNEASEKPDHQLLEKAVSGRYVGELIRLIIGSLVEEKLLFRGRAAAIEVAHSISAPEVALIIKDESTDLSSVANWVKTKWAVQELSFKELNSLRQISLMVVRRAARLIAATFIGILLRIDPGLKSRHVIGIDGSMFEKMPFFLATILQAFHEVYPEKSDAIVVKHINDGSSVGAAVAAAVVSQRVI
ncbi:hexokinase [Desulfotomaculum sp. 1211_IL3151]|uniref:hexokinase n=1 Tax=Desulfotomaculum sp. 1211_IL3151 TaxID=3084055 RepID=UPI002FDA96FD